MAPPDTYRQATVVSTHATLQAEYAELDRIAEKLQRDGAPEGNLEIYVVNEDREPVERPGSS